MSRYTPQGNLICSKEALQCFRMNAFKATFSSILWKTNQLWQCQMSQLILKLSSSKCGVFVYTSVWSSSGEQSYTATTNLVDSSLVKSACCSLIRPNFFSQLPSWVVHNYLLIFQSSSLVTLDPVTEECPGGQKREHKNYRNTGITALTNVWCLYKTEMAHRRRRYCS